MSNNTISPVFKFNFEQTDGTLIDLTGNGNNVTVKSTSACTPVADDPEMGRCMQFDGSSDSYISLSALAGSAVSELATGYTLTSWVNPDATVCTGNQGFFVFQLGLSNPNSYAQIGINNTQPYYRVWGGSNPPSVNATASVSADSWYHLAVTVDSSGKVIFYVNGQSSGGTTNIHLLLTKAADYVAIGKDHTNPDSTIFSGMMAWAALYNGPLGPTEILADMAEGQAKRAASFRQSFPLDFKLYSSDRGAENPIIFIENKGEGEDLNLKVINTSNSTLSIAQLKDKQQNEVKQATKEYYHFRLSFRSGILSQQFLNNASPDLANGADWSALVENTGIIYFLYIGSSSLSVLAGSEQVIVIKNVNATASGGTKNTNVEFNYQNVTPSNNSNTLLSGFRKQNISIVNHSGDRDISLRAQIVGVSSIMTYARQGGQGGDVANPPESDLMFRLVNTGSTLNMTPKSAGSDNYTTFTLTVDVQPPEAFTDWALFAQGDCTPSVLHNVIGVVKSYANGVITLEEPLTTSLDSPTALQIENVTQSVSVSASVASGSYSIPVKTTVAAIARGSVIQLNENSADWVVAQNTTGQLPPNQMQWIITNQNKTSFAQNEGMNFVLKGIVSSMPSGTSVVTVGYINVPGHWDGQFDLTVQRSPLAFNQNLMGINTQEPDANLHILEENGNIPFRVEKKSKATVPEILYTENHTIGQLEALPTPGTYYDAGIRYGNDNNVYLHIWTITNGESPVMTACRLTDEPTGTPGNGAGNVVFCNDRFYVLTNNSSAVTVYKLSTPNTVTYSGKSPQVPTHGYTQGLIPVGPIVTANGFLYTFSEAGGQTSAGNILIFNISGTNADIPAWTTPSQPTAFAQSTQKGMLGTEEYLYVFGDNNFYVCSYDSDGGLGILGTLSYPVEVNHIQKQGPYVLAINFEAPTVIIDVSDPASPNQVNVISPGLPVQHYVVHENRIIGGGSEGIMLYGFSGANIPRSVTLASTNNTAIGWVEDILFLSGGGSTDFYNVEKMFQYLLGANTFISAEGISVGTSSITPDASLSLPYPLDAGKSGLAIGDISTCTPASLSISIGKEDTADPLVINDANENAIFNIKQPSSSGGPYRVGIGTDKPKAPLHVSTSGTWNSTSTQTFNYFNSSTDPTSGSAKNIHQWENSANFFPVSILASDTVIGSQFFAISDVRIKELESASNGVHDLNTLLTLQVTNYQYIDFVGKGADQKKGLIAQQVKEVFPQAVSDQNTDFIPDIYAMATDVSWQPVTKDLRVCLEKVHDLKAGDNVRLIADEGFEEKEVVAVPDNKSFVVSEWEKPVDKLFVFGKEVHDFHTVDYDQVAMLGVSAIQALHQQLGTSDQKSAALENRIEALEKENSRLKLQLDEDLKRIRQELREFKAALSTTHEN